ncbi:ArsR/SmtB family transcription factor [Lactiplantibacillus modestisalitolerans]|uniref:ArsR/SmtB family transcription factor n=1 Tax=Lactiplantibacillus modestisalitolerans TaxID=1457219 RepID=A0ABV5WRA3_9LACO|nr:metalloregulator ArsR/SmtB family transcription factor [Lactiplantibacillus modestisalitolerans]
MQVSDAQLMEAAKIYKVLSNPKRIKLLLYLEKHPADVSSICQALNLAQPVVSHQLALLYQYQLVTRTKRGKHVDYCLDDPHIVELIEAMIGHVAHEIKHQPHPQK